jgi:hypothetical protein
MSSFEEYNKDNENTSFEDRRSIRLSTLNPKVREKLSKFDTLNDGEINLEEAIQGLVTLQKQSNNYKKTVYLLVPLMIIMLGCVLGINILAINLTKDIKTSGIENSNFLTNKQGEIVSTVSYTESKNFFEWLFEGSNNFVDILNIGTLRLKVDSLYLEEFNQTSTIYVSTPNIWFSLCSNGSYIIENVQGEYNNKIKALVEEQLQNYQDHVLTNFQTKTTLKEMTVIVDRPNPNDIIKTDNRAPTETTVAIGGFSCVKTSTRKCGG